MIASAETPSLVQPMGPARPSGSEQRLRTILIVEDDEAFAEMLRSLLERIPCKTELARNGAEAVKRILAHEFDFILCDIVMSEFPGEMFYRAVERARPQLCRRFIFMTGHRNHPEIASFIRSIGGILLWKPFEFAALLEAMMTVELQAERTLGQSARRPVRLSHLKDH